MTTVYDTGALLAAEGSSARMWALHGRLLADVAGPPVVPVAVLAQAWRGGPQAQLSRLLRGCVIHPDTEALGRAAGAACARTRTADVVDALVVVTAKVLGAGLVVTSDPRDLELLADAVGARFAIEAV